MIQAWRDMIFAAKQIPARTPGDDQPHRQHQTWIEWRWSLLISNAIVAHVRLHRHATRTRGIPMASVPSGYPRKLVSSSSRWI